LAFPSPRAVARRSLPGGGCVADLAIDILIGAPEKNPRFQKLVAGAE
jgi:hypothetical protein